MEEPSKGSTRSSAQPKAAPRQMASTPKRLSTRTEHRLAAQSFVATPEGDATDEAIQALPLQTHSSQAVRLQTPADAAGSGTSKGRLSSPLPPPQDHGHESPITSRQRPPAQASGAATKQAGGRPAAQHDRRGHVPPPDHHAEAQTGALPATDVAHARKLLALSRPAASAGGDGAQGAAPEPAVDESRTELMRPRGGRRGARPTAPEGSDASDQQQARSAEPQQEDQQQQQQPPKVGGVGKAAASLFSPVFSLFGGKAASEVPPPGPGESGDGAPDAIEPARPTEPAAKRGDSGDADPPRPAGPADDDVHSENDTQIRVPSGQSSDSQVRI